MHEARKNNPLQRTGLADEIRAFCVRWKITELAVFGSVLREDFGAASDIDVLVTFSADASWSYWEWPDMTVELERLFGRPVDLVEKKAIANPFIRQRVLATQRVLYAAA